ncbi:MAG: GGDEF domain-containing protein [Gammaproteobacteria bacterium]|nr:GGDEF domain-containing protein [Gammaproteobacteria bacterium]MBQ0840944.1 GGDEF domain-containing protein [Gammaproteobacteria bacterium]
MRQIVERLGRLNIIVLLTLVSITAAYTLTIIAHTAIGAEIPPSNTPVVIIVSTILTPLVATPFVNLLFLVFDLENKNRILAAYDPVTGLMSRQALVSQATNLLNLAQRKHSAVSMLFIDIDDFKSINDTHGHLNGDNALRSIGQYINTLKRESDLIGRYGGDELVALLPDTDQKGAKHFAEKLHAILRENPITASHETIPMTVSIGTSTYQGSARPVDIGELIRQSDLALYEAKERGKNRTASYITDDEFEST